MGKRQDPAEQLLDLLVYAPLGLLVEARELVPKLADKGRQRLGGQVTVARMVGELAVRQGQRQAERMIRRMREQSAAGGGATGATGRPANGQRPPPAAETVGPEDPPGARPASPAPAAAGDPASLAIPGYDTLSASQVVPRLEGLSVAELEAIRAYEEQGRARKTILTRVSQLLGNA